jgi:hypothetical protein
MNGSVPLGQAESERLEFKSKDALRHLSNISREVVGMLNANGGEIWIGLGEEQGRAVRIENVEQPSREISRLRDHFTDSIEPPLTSDEFEIAAIPTQGKGQVLRIRVKPVAKHRPYDLCEGTARHFVKRVQDRIRLMSPDEIRSEMTSAKPPPDHELDASLKELLEAKNRQQANNLLWLRIQPIGNHRLPLSRKDYYEYFIDHRKTGNRVSGWNFVSLYGNFVATPKEIRHGRDGEMCVRVFSSGAIEFTMPIANLYWKSTGWGGDAQANEIWPYALLEFPASVFRLAGTIYRERAFQAEEVVADLALFGVNNWTLRPYSPVSFGYKLAKPKAFTGKEIVAGPHKFSRKEIEEEPDRCAFRLVQRVYEEFDLFEEEMPSEFDRDSGQLILQGA